MNTKLNLQLANCANAIELWKENQCCQLNALRLLIDIRLTLFDEMLKANDDNELKELAKLFNLLNLIGNAVCENCYNDIYITHDNQAIQLALTSDKCEVIDIVIKKGKRTCLR